MKAKPKKQTEPQADVFVRRKILEAKLAEFKAKQTNGRRSRNIPAIILLMTGIYAAYAFDLCHSQNPRAKILAILPGFVLLAAYGLYRVGTARKAKQKTKAEADWYKDLDAVVDIKDFQDRYCLYGNLEAAQRQRLLRELQRMPRGSRSLLRAVQTICPELIDAAT